MHAPLFTFHPILHTLALKRLLSYFDDYCRYIQIFAEIKNIIIINIKLYFKESFLFLQVFQSFLHWQLFRSAQAYCRTGNHYVIPCEVTDVDSTSHFNLRSGPGTGYSFIDSLDYNWSFSAFVNSTSTYNTTNGGSSWTYIKYTKSGKSYNGWVSKSYVNFTPSGYLHCEEVKGIDSGSTLNVRSSNSTSSSIVGKLSPSAMVNIVGRAATSTEMWYRIRYDGTSYGYVSGTYLGVITQIIL